MPRKARIAVLAARAMLAAALLFLTLFPVEILRSTVEREPSEQSGAPVTLGALERGSFISFIPVITARDLRIGQPDSGTDTDVPSNSASPASGNTIRFRSVEPGRDPCVTLSERGVADSPATCPPQLQGDGHGQVQRAHSLVGL